MSDHRPKRTDALSIGYLAERTGLAVSAIRFYEEKGLIISTRNVGGQRRFDRASIRRLSFVRIAQGLGFSLADIRAHLDELPDKRTPNAKDWERLSKRFAIDIDERIAGLQQMRDQLTQCIGCGCLSLTHCKLYNPDDLAASLGDGPRYLLGDSAHDLDDR